MLKLSGVMPHNNVVPEKEVKTSKQKEALCKAKYELADVLCIGLTLISNESPRELEWSSVTNVSTAVLIANPWVDTFLKALCS